MLMGSNGESTGRTFMAMQIAVNDRPTLAAAQKRRHYHQAAQQLTQHDRSARS